MTNIHKTAMALALFGILWVGNADAAGAREGASSEELIHQIAEQVGADRSEEWRTEFSASLENAVRQGASPAALRMVAATTEGNLPTDVTVAVQAFVRAGAIAEGAIRRGASTTEVGATIRATWADTVGAARGQSGGPQSGRGRPPGTGPPSGIPLGPEGRSPAQAILEEVRDQSAGRGGRVPAEVDTPADKNRPGGPGTSGDEGPGQERPDQDGGDGEEPETDPPDNPGGANPTQ